MFTVPNGYAFGGWYTDADCTNGAEKAVGSNELLMTDLHLYAKWVPNKFAVSYFVDNVQDGETEEHAVGTDVTVKATPTKTGYTFSGWTPAADVANIIKVADGKFTMPAQNVLFNGTFTINQYNVTYKVGTEVVYTDVYNFNSDVAIRPVPTKDGYTFTGWKIGDKDAENFKMPAHNVEIHGSYRQNTRKYTVNKHFYDEKGAEIAELASTANASGAENAPIADLYKADAANQTVDGKNYVYVPGLTKVTDNLEKLTKDVTIDLHYYLNVEGGNDTPDAWEYRLTFKVVNGEWNDGGNADLVAYVPFKDYKTGKDLEYVVVPATRIPPVGEKPNSGYHAGSWDTTPVGNDKVQKDTVFTYTYAKNSSGGSSGGSSGSSSGSSGSSGGSTSANVGNAYGAAGVVSAGQSVAANAYVVSDTTVNFTLKRGSAYCFKMTVVNGNAMTPSFTVGNGDVLKTQFVAKIGNDYYYRVYAIGTPGQSTGVYTTLPGQNAVKHCTVTIA